MTSADDFKANVLVDLKHHCDAAGFLVCVGSEGYAEAWDRIMRYAIERGAFGLTQAQFDRLEMWIGNRISRSAQATLPAWEAAQATAGFAATDHAAWAWRLRHG